MAETSMSELFQMMGGVASIDWDALARKGKNTIFNSDYILDYMYPAASNAMAVFDTLEFKPESKADLIETYWWIDNSLKDPLTFAKNARKAGLNVLPIGEAFKMTTGELRAFVYYTWLTIVNGVIMHRDQTMIYAYARSHSDGQITARDQNSIMDHAELITMMCNVVVKLDKAGVFNQIKKPGMAGLGNTYSIDNYVRTDGSLGALPVVAVVVIAVAAIAALAWLVMGIAEVASREATVYSSCKKAAESGDKEGLQLCRDLANTTPSPSGDMASKIGWLVGIGAGAYILVAFGPAIAQSLKQAVDSFKKSATA
jgi:hypothetical protein